MMSKILVLLVLIASPFSSAQSEADILSLRPTGFRPAPLTGETSLDYLSLLREINRNTHQRLAEMDYLLTGNVIVPRSLVLPTVHELELPAFTRLDHISNTEVEQFANHLKGYSEMALAPLVNVLSASYAVLSKAYQARYHSLTGFRDVSLDTVNDMKKTLAKLKDLMDAVDNLKTGIDGLRIRALAFLDSKQESQHTINLSYPEFLHEIRVDLFEQRLRRTQIAWADLQSEILKHSARDRAESLGRWIEPRRPIDSQAIVQLGVHFLAETHRILKRVRLLGNSADSGIASSFSERDNIVPLFTPGSQPAQRAVSQSLSNVNPKMANLYLKMRELYELARDLRALYLENPDRFSRNAFPNTTENQREVQLHNFEQSAQKLLEDLHFLMLNAEQLSEIWSENGSFSGYIDRQWPQWQKAQANARNALLQLNPSIRSALSARGCAQILTDPNDPSGNGG